MGILTTSVSTPDSINVQIKCFILMQRYGAREGSVYPAWPFPIAVESCTTQQEVCTVVLDS